MYKKRYDVIVVGSGPGGFTAAVAAARGGMQVLLIERNPFFGGLLASGLPILAFLDRSGRQVVAGIAEEFVQRLREVGGATEHFFAPIQNSLTYLNMNWARIMVNEMLREAHIDTMLYGELAAMKMQDGHARSVEVFSRGEMFSFETDIVIDGTGDACCAYMAGAACEKGTELQPATLTFDVENIDIEAFSRYVREHPETIKMPDTFPGITQSADDFGPDKTFATMCFFDLIEKAREAGDFTLPRNMIDFTHQKGSGRGYFNVTRAINTDSTDIGDFNRAEDTCEHQVLEIMRFLRKYCPGFANCTLGQLMPYLGIRESRRIVGRKKLTREILKDLPVPEDTVALTGYNVDIHGQTSGIMTMLPVAHGIGIPYGCLVPEKIEGLLIAGRPISVDQTVFGMTRIMSACMAVGEAAGTAAAIAWKQGVLPSQVNVGELRAQLKRQGAVVDLPDPPG